MRRAGSAAYRGGMTSDPSASASPRPLPARRHPLGLSVTAIIALAALGVPRVVLHDLHVISESSPVNWLLAIAPVLVWIFAAVVRRVPNPFVTVLMIGTTFGVMLVVTHQLLWESAFRGTAPALGDGPAAALIPRLAAIPSGLFTGAIIGAIAGLIAWGVLALTRRAQA